MALLIFDLKRVDKREKIPMNELQRGKFCVPLADQSGQLFMVLADSHGHRLYHCLQLIAVEIVHLKRTDQDHFIFIDREGAVKERGGVQLEHAMKQRDGRAFRKRKQADLKVENVPR